MGCTSLVGSGRFKPMKGNQYPCYLPIACRGLPLPYRLPMLHEPAAAAAASTNSGATTDTPHPVQRHPNPVQRSPGSPMAIWRRYAPRHVPCPAVAAPESLSGPAAAMTDASLASRDDRRCHVHRCTLTRFLVDLPATRRYPLGFHDRRSPDHSAATNAHETEAPALHFPPFFQFLFPI